MPRLVQPLFDGPLDLVGDVHGEIEALLALVERLGYGSTGAHPRGRRLVFTGDLTDRGPDSPAVVRFVQRLVEANRAQCVLGNHDLNILLGLRKFDNPWFYGEAFRAPNGVLLPQQLADEATRTSILDFFRSAPLALERPDLRVAHAYWDARMIALARAATSATALHDEHRGRIDADHRARREADPIVRELDHQNLNPVKLITSGPEERAPLAFESGGKLRQVRRVQWWESRDGESRGATGREPRVEDGGVFVFGHYGLPRGTERGGPSAFCVDYGVGKRSLERAAKAKGFTSKLAAMRWPERQIVFDDGLSETWKIATATAS